ncbi:MAG TPA: carotenoid 1,2-hydratase, partial [Planctomycetota bacterium]|nr:carotenoid 1,2-hydratase [Planctomycetota bacterium]
MRRSPRRVRSFAILGVALLPLSIAAADDGWRQALPGRKIELPTDHASHPDFKIEWWYYTGNLETPGGERFGYQLTFFRSGVAKEPKSPSRWAVRDLYLAHFAISAIDDESFRSHERFNRKGVAWAGIDADAETKRVRIFNDGWEATIDGDVHVLRAIDGKDAIELRLESKKPPV